MLTYDKVKNILLDELRSRGYSPNPADVHLAAVRIVDLAKEPDEEEPVKSPSKSKSEPPKS